MQELEGGVRGFRARAGEAWVGAFVDFYLSEKRTCSLTESCALQSLTGEVARGDDEIRATFESQLHSVVNAAAEGLAGTSPKARRRERSRSWRCFPAVFL